MLANLCGMFLGLVLSAVATTNDQAMSLVPLAALPQIIFSGLIEIDSLDWVSRLMPSYWAYRVLGSLTNLNTKLRVPNKLFDTQLSTAWTSLYWIGLAYFGISLWFLQKKGGQNR